MALDPRNPKPWQEWIKTVPAALGGVGLLLAFAHQVVREDDDLDAVYRRLRVKWEQIVRSKFNLRGADALRIRYVLEAVLCQTIIQYPGAPDAFLLDAAQGVETTRTQAEQTIEEDGLLAKLFNDAEAARNGHGGSNPVRRSQ